MAIRDSLRRAEERGRRVYGAAEAVTQRRRYSARQMLTAELLVGIGIVALRAVADYEPQADGTLKGKIGHPAGQYGPLPVLAGLIGSFFLLSFLAARGGTRGKVAVAGGALLITVLAMKSVDEIQHVAATFSSFGKAKVPPGAWQTSGTAAGTPIIGSVTAPAGGGSGTHLPAGTVRPVNGSCPAGYALYTGPGTPPGGICTPLTG